VFATNEGRTMIARFYDWLLDMTGDSITVERVSSVVQNGDLVTFLVHDVNGLDHAWTILFRDGKVAEQFAAIPEQ
jgi:predicted SnoaL-like aldol condensation-catalyzing enzyme